MQKPALFLFLFFVYSADKGESLNELTQDYTTVCGQQLVSLPRIVGGERSTPGKWPWQVLLEYNSQFICGGALISERWIITAAHCVDSDPRSANYKVILGAFNRAVLERTTSEYSVSKINIHSRYNPSKYVNDIALLQLDRTVQFTNFIVPVCLPQESETVATGKDCWATGWGRTSVSSSATSNTLQEAELPIVSDTICRNLFSSVNIPIISSHLCAGYLNPGVGTCRGDSGGPLVCRDSASSPFVLQGITSFGIPCARGYPDVFTRISSFTNWIEATTNIGQAPTDDPHPTSTTTSSYPSTTSSTSNDPHPTSTTTSSYPSTTSSTSTPTDDPHPTSTTTSSYPSTALLTSNPPSCDAAVDTNTTLRLPVNSQTGLYPNNFECVWSIISKGRRTEIKFVEQFDIEEPVDAECLDYVAIVVAGNQFGDRLCGRDFPFNVIFERGLSESVEVVFRSNPTHSFGGFSIEIAFSSGAVFQCFQCKTYLLLIIFVLKQFVDSLF